MSEKIFVLSNDGCHSETTHKGLIDGMAAIGAKVELIPSRIGDFYNVRVNGNHVARGFKSSADMIVWKMERM